MMNYERWAVQLSRSLVLTSKKWVAKIGNDKLWGGKDGGQAPCKSCFLGRGLAKRDFGENENQA